LMGKNTFSVNLLRDFHNLTRARLCLRGKTRRDINIYISVGKAYFAMSFSTGVAYRSEVGVCDSYFIVKGERVLKITGSHIH